MLKRLVTMARRRRVIRGERMRVDTTVVETSIHYPTDSSLLGDGIRVLQRGVRKLRELVGGLKLRDRTRSVRRRIFEIARLSRRPGSEEVQSKRKKRYRELMRLTKATVREVERSIRSVARRKLAAPVSSRAKALCSELRGKLALVNRVLAQTRARILQGDTHHPDKLLSLFEPHTEAIRKGKASKPTEFGKLVKIQEAESQFITDFEVCLSRVPDQTLWVSSLQSHQQRFGRPPRLATADAGFASAANRQAAEDMGIKKVALLGKTKNTSAPQRRWFRKALRWRTGSEGRISALKRRHGLRRSRYRGMDGMQRWVGLGVFSNNLLAMARADLGGPS